MILDDYLNLITSEYRQKPNFIAVATAGINPLLQIQTVLQSMIPKFDVDVAVGDQLDIIGEWAGISRNLAIPISGVYFSWDGADANLGWDAGIWQPPLAPTEVTSLPDDSYRILLKAKIAANQWDGTTTGAYAIWDSVFTEFTILIQDNENMSYDLAIGGGQVDSLTLALITGGYIPLKPEGIRVNFYYVPVGPGPIFAWDLENTLLQGWDEGAWTREIPG